MSKDIFILVKSASDLQSTFFGKSMHKIYELVFITGIGGYYGKNSFQESTY